MCEIIKKLSNELDIQVIFQTGKKNFDMVIEQLLLAYPDYERDNNLIIRPYFEDMVTVLKASDVAVSRSGSLSISEICASAIAPIFVPYPHAAADHQRKNAKFMCDKNAGLYIEDAELSPQKLYETIRDLISNTDKLHDLQKNSLALAKFDGTEMIVAQLKDIINGK